MPLDAVDVIGGNRRHPKRQLSGCGRGGSRDDSGHSNHLGDMTILTNLEARNAGISDLTGLELATNLIRLNLSNESLFETFESVQPVDVDTVSVGGGCFRDADYTLRWVILRLFSQH